jgi:Na+-transporting methylmalonyl-CoA/oxaloacetate decarboxylase gamma subunit
MLHFILLTVVLCAMFVVGIVAGREWERAALEEEYARFEAEQEKYKID